MSKLLVGAVLFGAVAVTIAQEQPATQPTAEEGRGGRGARGGRGRGGGGFGTTPPANNESTLRELSPEEIPPNLNFYSMDPLYKPGIPLGWSETRIEEKLNRGIVAMPMEGGKVYIGWRLLKTDPQNIAFNLYRVVGNAAPVKVNSTPLATTTDFTDSNVALTSEVGYFVRPVVNGTEGEPSERSVVAAGSEPTQYKAIRVREDVTGISMCAIGDLDGDGVYDFVVKHPGGGRDPGRVGTNSNGSYKFDGYNGRTGQFMWRVDLGWNVDMGVWWTPFVVRDLDGDNKAELCVRGSTYAATREEMHPDGQTGFILNAPEYLIVYSGETGQEIDRAPWIELGKVQDWADNTGNRASRHMMGVAYLDGKTPSVLAVRGTYGQMKVDAWVLKNKKLEKIWRWTNERAFFKYQGQGQHSIKVADIDGDGMDEILNGSIAIDNDGKTLWGTGMGHGDRFYCSDIDPDRPGLEVWYTIEEPHPKDGVSLWDARTGRWIFGIDEPNRDNQIGGGLASDILPEHPGMEVWGGGGGADYLFTCKGQRLEGAGPGGVIWWDGDLTREVLGGGGGGGRRGGGAGGGASISKFRGDVLTTGIQGSSQQVADILGDWREENVTFINGEIRTYSTTIPAVDRRACLMQDSQYRHDVTIRTMGYPHFPLPSFYLGAK